MIVSLIRVPIVSVLFLGISRGMCAQFSGGVSDMRPIIHYRDLDAPREPEDFL